MTQKWVRLSCLQRHLETQAINDLQTWQRGLPEQWSIHPGKSLARSVPSEARSQSWRRLMRETHPCFLPPHRFRENQLGNSSEGTPSIDHDDSSSCTNVAANWYTTLYNRAPAFQLEIRHPDTGDSGYTSYSRKRRVPH